MPTTSSYGDLAAILAVGALFYIGYQSFTNSAIIGAVAKDPCAGLTGATLAACRKAHPEYKGITPSIAKKPLVPAGGGTRLVSTGPKPAPDKVERTVKVTPDSETLKRLGFNLPGGFRNVTLPPNASADERKKCETMVLAVQKYLQERKPIDKAAILRKYRSFGYTEKDLNCGIEEAKGRMMHIRGGKTGIEDFEQYWLKYQKAPGHQQLGSEDTSLPGNTRNPIDHFVNGITSFLQQAWNNLTQGKTAIGGQPTVLTGSPSAPTVRPMVAPIV